jgi:cellulose synthase/poly-beta-1,6-N-acetylglucosamine synthase-like glycosyltransferase
MNAAVVGAQWLFWVCLFLVLYSYFLYPLILFAVYSLSQIPRDWRYLTSRRDRRTPSLGPTDLPRVSLVVAAYNEEDCLPEKIQNARELNYPADHLELVFVSDGSIDRTNEILSNLKEQNVRIALLSRREGKATAINRGIALAQCDILIFSDAATLFCPDAIQKLVRHFSDPSVGVVCGALQFRASEESRQTEGVYWKYESMLRLMEGRLGATLTASGAIYAVRRVCFRELAKDTILEDFIIPMHARKEGFQVVYDPEAVAVDFAASSVAGEFTRRVRLAVGSFRALGELIHTPLKGFALLAFVSHKLLRWVVPFLLIGMIVCSCLLLHSTFYRVVAMIQVLFYLWAAMGYLFEFQAKRVRFGLLGYFWLAMNLAFLVGFWRFLFSHRDSTWQKVR